MSYLKGYPHCSVCDAAGIASEDCPYCHSKIVGYLKAEIERLRAIVDKLPKCWRLNEQGQLVQDEPILSGMNVVTIRKTNAKIRTEEVGVLSVVACEDCGFDIVIRDGYGDEWYFKEEELYLTREAAEAAKEK